MTRLAGLERHALDAARRCGPCGVTSASSKRTALPPSENSITSCCAVGQRGADQVVAVVEVDRDDAGLARVAEVVQRRLLDGAQRRRHEDEMIRRERALNSPVIGSTTVIFSSFSSGNMLTMGLPRELRRALRHFPDLQPVHAAGVGEAQDPVVRVRDEQLVDPVVFLRLRGLLAAAAAALRAVLGQRLALEVAGVAERDDHVGGRDQVFGAELLSRCARCGCGARPAWSCRTLP